MPRKIASFLVTAVLAAAMSSAAFAASTQWARVITVKTDNLSAYMAELDKGRAMLKRLGVSVQLRVWRAQFAGPQAGTLIVTQEYPSWAAFADGQAKTMADPEFGKWLAGLDKVRTIVSDSLYREL